MTAEEIKAEEEGLPKNPKDYITVEEIAEFLGMSVASARELTVFPWFPSIPFGKSYKQYTTPRSAFNKLINDPERVVQLKQKIFELEKESKKNGKSKLGN